MELKLEIMSRPSTDLNRTETGEPTWKSFNWALLLFIMKVELFWVKNFLSLPSRDFKMTKPSESKRITTHYRNKRLTTKRIRNITKSTQATWEETASTRHKPRAPAIRAMIRNSKAQLSMIRTPLINE